MSHKVQKMKSGIRAFLLTVLLLVCFIPFKAALSTDAGLLPNGVQQFFDNNGNPLSSGKVYFYEVGTLTFKDTYTSSSGAVTNTNPITLNAGGKASTGGIYGVGLYRQIVKDRNGNLIWDAVTAPGGGGGTTPTDVGDGNLVGTVLPWSGLIAPNQYAFAYGQEIARTAYPEFYTAITQSLNVICSSGSNILTGLTDTTQVNLGSPVEASLCFVPGTTVVAKTGATVTVSNPASVSINTTAIFYPYGNGDGSTTFNVPDLRGYTVAGRDNMGGTAAGRLTTTYYGTKSPDALGATGGSQTHDTQFPQVLVTTGGTLSANSLATATINSIQPTITLNYVIKITPDVSSSTVAGVAAINGMTGVISCGSGLLCTGNIINTSVISMGSVSLVSTGWGLTGGPCTVSCTVSVGTTNPAFQFGNAVNLEIDTSAASNALTISLKANDGTDPSVTNPILIPFRNVTTSTGSPTWIALTAANSTTIISGATLGTISSVPFRLWVVAVNDGGTVRVCTINTLSYNIASSTISANAVASIYPLPSNGILTSLSTPGNLSQTFYCGAIVSAKSYTVLGYVTYTSGLGTAGLYTAIPNTIQLYGPGVPLPGTIVQTRTTTTVSAISIAVTTKAPTFLTDSILRLSSANPIKITAYGQVQRTAASGANSAFLAQLYRGAAGVTAIGNLSSAYSPGGAFYGPTINSAFDDPQSGTLATEYGLYLKLSTGTDSWTWLGVNSSVPTNTGVMTIEEIMR